MDIRRHRDANVDYSEFIPDDDTITATYNNLTGTDAQNTLASYAAVFVVNRAHPQLINAGSAFICDGQRHTNACGWLAIHAAIHYYYCEHAAKYVDMPKVAITRLFNRDFEPWTLKAQCKNTSIDGVILANDFNTLANYLHMTIRILQGIDEVYVPTIGSSIMEISLVVFDGHYRAIAFLKGCEFHDDRLQLLNAFIDKHKAQLCYTQEDSNNYEVRRGRIATDLANRINEVAAYNFVDKGSNYIDIPEPSSYVLDDVASMDKFIEAQLHAQFDKRTRGY